MTRQRAKSADQTSLATPETAGALRSPLRAYGEPRRLLSSAPFQSSSGECRLKWTSINIERLASYALIRNLFECGVP